MDATFAASPGQAHYLGSVMRQGAGAELRLFNGRDGEWLGRLDSIRKDRAMLRAIRPVRAQVAEPDLWLVFALVKRDATDLIVRAATELGVSALVPVLCARSQAARINPDRLLAIATEAAEQCERLSVPALHAPMGLAALLAHWDGGRCRVVAAERQDAPVVQAPGGPAALLVGPEGGFTPEELTLLSRAPFVRFATLGPRILRAETAAIAGLALLQRDPPP